MIYYGTANGYVKIGYTDKNLWERTQSHRKRYPDYVVLAAHGGRMSDEAMIHRQFRHLLIDGEKEWFLPGADLLQHVVNVARGNYLGMVEIEPRMAVADSQGAIPVLNNADIEESDDIVPEGIDF